MTHLWPSIESYLQELLHYMAKNMWTRSTYFCVLYVMVTLTLKHEIVIFTIWKGKTTETRWGLVFWGAGSGVMLAIVWLMISSSLVQAKLTGC